MKRLLFTGFLLLVLVCQGGTNEINSELAKRSLPSQKGTCLVIGDPHYRTFDGHYYNFMGNCTYILAKNCRADEKHPEFEINTKNERYGNTQNTLVSEVTVLVDGNRITLRRFEYGVVMINDLSWNFPVSLNNGRVKLQANSIYATVETDFGLSVLYDWDQYLVVTVPDSFKGRMCGMCGNFNGKKNDDLTTSSDCNAGSIPELGKSWRVPNVPGDAYCRDGCLGRCRGCQDASWYTRMNAKISCSAVTFLTKDSFKKCSSVIDPRVFYDICKYEYCSGKDVRRFLCNTAEIYTVACKEAGIHVLEWRKLLKCPHPTCPKNSHFESCACPATCENRTPSAECKANCMEGCVCDPGYLWSGNKCVPQTQCGCFYKNGADERYLQAGESIWADDTCTQTCTCNAANGQVKCVTAYCPVGTECKKVKGSLGCHSAPYGTCSIRGDPHYKTFDNVTYDFQGTCTYTAAQACNLEGTALTPFTVVVENEGWNENQRNPIVSFAKVVIVEVYDFIIVLRRNQIHQVMVNGILTNIPVSLNEGEVTVQREGSQNVVITNFGLRVAYNMVYDVIITVPYSYYGKTCGLCGNYNGKRNDEFLLPDGKEAREIAAFGAAWKLAVPGVVCGDGCSGDYCPKCPEDKKQAFEKDCSVINNPYGPFAACHYVIDPDSYFRDCVFDVCIGGGDAHMLCHSITAYMSDCHAFGVTVKNWRTPTLCPLTCPANSKYEVCAKTCNTPCPSLGKVMKCHKQACVEGCMCEPGFFSNGTSCVKEDQCGCHVNGHTYEINQVVLTDSCQQRMTCHASGKVTYEDMSCKNDEVCLLKDGVRGCYPKQCSLEAEGSFTLFSGHKWILSSVGFYELVKVCNDALVAEWFRVVVELKTFGRYSSAVSVHIFFEETFISIKSTKITWVNGRLVRLPHRIKEITIQESEDVIILEHRSGFRVSYSLSKGVIATVGEKMKDKMCGICGIDSKITVIEEYLHNYKALDFTCYDL